MTLEELGFDEWFQAQRLEAPRPDCDVARLTRIDRNRYLIRNTERELPAEPAGKLFFRAESEVDRPCVGDWAYVQYRNDGTDATILGLLPRKSVLLRKTAGKDIEHQVIAANVDAALIMQSCDRNYNLRRLERYIVTAREGKIEPIVLLSKSDLDTDEAIMQRVDEITASYTGIRAAAFTTMMPGGTAPVRQLLERGKTYCLIGSSGVGKTTLLNDLLGDVDMATNPVRESDGRGRHTTTYRQLMLLRDGPILIDTPGMRELGLLVDVDSIDDTFDDIDALSQECKFNDCSHMVEKGCAVRRAVETGDIDEHRYENYVKMKKEAAFYQMSYVEKRRKDRQFGHMVNEVLKHKKKW